MKFRKGAVVCSATLALLVSACTKDTSNDGKPQEELGSTQQAVTANFAAGSLIIPMDTQHQDNAIPRAYGLVYALLRANVPVSWAINTGKAQDGTDFTVPAGATLQNARTKAAVAVPQAYHGGSFIVDSADRAAANPVVAAWLGTNNDVTVVHALTAGTFPANIVKKLTAAPAIAVFEDGAEDVAYAYLNTAGITDSANNAWTQASPGSHAPADMAGTAGVYNDGALWGGGFPAFSFITSEHYENPDVEIVAEVRTWLAAGAYVHGFMQCAATSSFENVAAAGQRPGGHFLTTNGVNGNGNRPNPLTNRNVGDPIAQYVGGIQSDTGVTAVLNLAANSALRANARVLINQTGAAANTIDMMALTGVLDGDTTKGKVTYLTGHNYATDQNVIQLPVSTHPQTNGVRIFYNALFDSPSALDDGQPQIATTLTAPATDAGTTLTYTVQYTNNGSAPAHNVMVVGPLPAGTTFASAGQGGTQNGNNVEWAIGTLGPGATQTVTYTVNVMPGATVTDTAHVNYLAWQTPRTSNSNPTSTTVSGADTTPPDTSIVSGPPATTTATTATFDFDSTEPGSTFECSLDGAAAFSPCTDPVTFGGPFAVGPHTLSVRARDAANNVDPTPAGWSWTVTATDTTPPETTIVSGPPATTPNTSADFDFMSSEPGTFECNLDNTQFVACTDPSTFSNLGVGPHTLAVRARDLANNVDPTPASWVWSVTATDTTPPETTIVSGPPATTPQTTATFDFSSNEPGTFECSVDGSDFLVCTDPVTFPGPFAPGPHTLLVRARDLAGNIDPTPAMQTWIVDNGGTPDAGGTTDTDQDGLPDSVEINIGTNPNDADSDDDGVLDGQEPDFDKDTDGDGLINALDPDSDGDGLFDGTELGLGCNNAATDLGAGHCIADADNGATKTNPLDKDTDHGSVSDGVEDKNHNGQIDPGETDPNNGADDVASKDSDGDGIPDVIEIQIGTDPNDADTDDDGVPDGQEPDFDKDTDGDGLINARDPDSDNDGLFDGTELGFDCSNPATNKSKGNCVPDADMGATKTDPLKKDTDNGGVSDGSEDKNLNGKIDPGETDPNDPTDDMQPTNKDTDGDGLSDDVEKTIGSNPNDADSDDDGVPDGQEPNPAADTDGDGKKNVNDSDSDNDGLFDGTELGLGCNGPGTDKSKNQCIADADPTTKTNPLDPDTDHGGVKDGDEDTNKNGKVDPGERDPLNPKDDKPCTADSDCGNATSGLVCVSSACGPGCRGIGGNGCTAGQKCSSTSATAGTCGTGATPNDGGVVTPDGGAGGNGLGAGALVPNSLEGGGVNCSSVSGLDSSDAGAPTAAVGALLALAVAGGRRRRRR